MISISYSKITTYRMCGLCYYYRYIKKKIMPPSISQLTGSVFHKTYQFNFKQKMLTNKDMPVKDLVDYYKREFDTHKQDLWWPKSVEEKEKSEQIEYHREKGLKLVEVFYEIAQNLRPLLVEELMPVIVSGKETFKIWLKPDLFVKDDVIDYKISKRKKDFDFNQLLLYSLAYQQKYGKKPDRLTFFRLIYTKTQEKFQVSTIDGKVEAQPTILLNEVNLVLKGIKNGLFYPAPPDHWLCSERYCQYYEECPYGKLRHETYKELGER